MLRGLLFAAVHIPRDLPIFWGVVVEFAAFGKLTVVVLGKMRRECWWKTWKSLSLGHLQPTKVCCKDWLDSNLRKEEHLA